MSKNSSEDNVIYKKCWNMKYGISIGGVNYWVQKSRIPIGTKRPYEIIMDEKGYIPEDEIVSIPFDSKDTPFTNRKAFNVLLLGGTGDGKSLMMKNIWFFLHEAGYFTGYFDPKSLDAGRARIKWNGSPRIAPSTEPKGIELDHFMPVWATKKFKEMTHNFRLYSSDINEIDEVEMWRGLGMSSVSAPVVNKLVNDRKHTIESLKKDLVRNPYANRDRLPANSFNNAFRVLTEMETSKLASTEYKSVNLLHEWSKGKALVFSYNNKSVINMSFDIGHKVNKSANLATDYGNRTPIAWIFDDAGYYARELRYTDFNFSLEEIKNILFNYRTRGLNCLLATQSLNIVSEVVTEAFPFKIITPKFKNPDQLIKLQIPNEAIDWLKSDMLVIRKDLHLMQMILVNENNEAMTFFPFTPPCNHFTEIYHPDYDNIEKR